MTLAGDRIGVDLTGLPWMGGLILLIEEMGDEE